MAKGENQDSVRHLTVINNSAGSHRRIFRSETPYMISDEPRTIEQLLLVALTPIGNQKASWERMGQAYRGLKAVELGPSPPPTPSISNPGQVGVQAARVSLRACSGIWREINFKHLRQRWASVLNLCMGNSLRRESLGYVSRYSPPDTLWLC